MKRELLERNLKRLTKIRDWYWNRNEEDKAIQDYMNCKYKVYNALCNVWEMLLSYNEEEINVDDINKLWVNKMVTMYPWYSVEKWLITRWLNILIWIENWYENEMEFINSFIDIDNKRELD